MGNRDVGFSPTKAQRCSSGAPGAQPKRWEKPRGPAPEKSLAGTQFSGIQVTRPATSFRVFLASFLRAGAPKRGGGSFFISELFKFPTGREKANWGPKNGLVAWEKGKGGRPQTGRAFSSLATPVRPFQAPPPALAGTRRGQESFLIRPATFGACGGASEPHEPHTGGFSESARWFQGPENFSEANGARNCRPGRMDPPPFWGG